MLLRFSQLTTHKGAELSAIEHAVPMIVFSPDGTVLRANDLSSARWDFNAMT